MTLPLGLGLVHDLESFGVKLNGPVQLRWVIAQGKPLASTCPNLASRTVVERHNARAQICLRLPRDQQNECEEKLAQKSIKSSSLVVEFLAMLGQRLASEPRIEKTGC
jgi:hypothetical protein